MNLYRRVISYYRPFAGSISFAVVLLLVSIGLHLLKPWPVKYLVDDVLKAQGPQYLLPFLSGSYDLGAALLIICLTLVGVNLLWGVFNLLNTYWLIKIGLKALLKLRTEIYAYLQSLPLRFHDNRRSGDSTFRVAYDSQAIQTFFNRGFATILSSVITLAGSFVVMYSMSPRLTWISLAVVPFLLAAIFYFATRIRNESIVLQQEESDVLSRASEGLSSIRVVHAFTREDYEVDEFTRECRESIQANLKLNMTNVASTLIVGLIVAFGTAALWYFGADEVVRSNGKFTLGDLLVFVGYLAMLYQPLEQLSYTVWAVEGAAAGVTRSFEILDARNEIADTPDAKKFHSNGGKIEFRDIHFAYENDHPIIKGINLVVQPGETVALVGSTGSGKTTLLSLVPRFYDPLQGQVLVDDQDVKSVTKNSLRQDIAMVLQDTLLFNATVRENIAYGRSGATQKEIEAAAIAAQADDFIRKMPKGYETIVGERGVKLSGGQRQRLGIARAFLKNSSILLLDEPTSALDQATEAEIMDTLKALMRRPTTLIVTHRLNTIHDVDRICFLENGKIVEMGTGQELLNKQGAYWRMWNSHSAASKV